MRDIQFQNKWNAIECHEGRDCWCRVIVAENDDPNDCVIPSGSVNKEMAEHIVQLHNAWLGEELGRDC